MSAIATDFVPLAADKRFFLAVIAVPPLAPSRRVAALGSVHPLTVPRLPYEAALADEMTDAIIAGESVLLEYDDCLRRVAEINAEQNQSFDDSENYVRWLIAIELADPQSVSADEPNLLPDNVDRFALDSPQLRVVRPTDEDVDRVMRSISRR